MRPTHKIGPVGTKMKILSKIVVVLTVVLAVASFVIWRIERNPYDDKYFTPEMQAKYPSVESVLDAFRTGWNGESKENIALLNEVYGWDMFSGEDHVHDGDIPSLKSISYYKSKKLAAVVFEPTREGSMGMGWWFVWRKGRWVFYPETIWLGLLEGTHSK